MDIHWYPGHMMKAKRQLIEQMKKVDIAVELCDARLPLGSRNPDLEEVLLHKPRVLLLNKADLASEAGNRAWTAHFEEKGIQAIPFVAVGQSRKAVIGAISRAAEKKVMQMQQKGVKKTVRALIFGIPNVGKSTLINCLRGAAVAKTGDRPGVTRGNQWVSITPYLELFDTPGMLWPKLTDKDAARRLAYIGAVRDGVLDTQTLSGLLLEELLQIDPDPVMARFKLVNKQDSPQGLLAQACRGRGWLLSGGRLDEDRGAAAILDEFRGGKLGRWTLEWPASRMAEVSDE